MDGIIVIGEGEKDEAPMLFNGERWATATCRWSTWRSIPSTAPR
ncbi:MAG: fructose-bisphosphatase class II [Acidimicrobiales bacterium]